MLDHDYKYSFVEEEELEKEEVAEEKVEDGKEKEESTE